MMVLQQESSDAFQDSQNTIEMSHVSGDDGPGDGGAPSQEDHKQRLEAFEVFLTNIQRKWSPSVFPGEPGVIEAHPTNESFEDFEFNWSIDQVALLNPVDFSSERNDLFLEKALQEVRSNQEFRRKCDDFFNQSKILPSPDLGSATSSSSLSHYLTSGRRTPIPSHLNGRSPQSLNLSAIPSAAYYSSNVFSPFSRRRTMMKKSTPPSNVPEEKDMSVCQSKLPTPVNGTKTRRKKNKLFVEDSGEEKEERHLLQPLQEDSNSCSTADDTEFDLRNDSVTAFSGMTMGDLALSPIVQEFEDTRLEGEDLSSNLTETDEAFSRDVETMETSNQFELPAGTTSIDSGCISKIQKQSFLFKTSTPSHVKPTQYS